MLIFNLEKRKMDFSVDKSERRIELPKETIDNLIKDCKEEYLKKIEIEKNKKYEDERRNYLEKKWVREVDRLRRNEKKLIEKKEKKELRRKKIYSFLYRIGIIKTEKETNKLNSRRNVSNYLNSIKRSKTKEIF